MGYLLLSLGIVQLSMALFVMALSFLALHRGESYDGFGCAALLCRTKLPLCIDLVYSDAGHVLQACAMFALVLRLLNPANPIWTSAHPLWMVFACIALGNVLLSIIRCMIA